MSNICSLKRIDLEIWKAAHKQFPEPPSAEIKVAKLSDENIERIRSDIDRMSCLLEEHDRVIIQLLRDENSILKVKVLKLELEAQADRSKKIKEMCTL